MSFVIQPTGVMSPVQSTPSRGASVQPVPSYSTLPDHFTASRQEKRAQNKSANLATAACIFAALTFLPQISKMTNLSGRLLKVTNRAQLDKMIPGFLTLAGVMTAAEIYGGYKLFKGLSS